MTRLSEVISTVKRRRAWSVEEKVAILDAAFRPGGSVAATADRFGVSRVLIYLWRKQVRDGAMPGVAMTDAGVSAFAPVTVAPDAPCPAALPDKSARARRRIEVRFVNGRMLHASEDIAPDVLARLVTALDGERS